MAEPRVLDTTRCLVAPTNTTDGAYCTLCTTPYMGPYCTRMPLEYFDIFLFYRIFQYMFGFLNLVLFAWVIAGIYVQIKLYRFKSPGLVTLGLLLVDKLVVCLHAMDPIGFEGVYPRVVSTSLIWLQNVVYLMMNMSLVATWFSILNDSMRGTVKLGIIRNITYVVGTIMSLVLAAVFLASLFSENPTTFSILFAILPALVLIMLISLKFSMGSKYTKVLKTVNASRAKRNVLFFMCTYA